MYKKCIHLLRQKNVHKSGLADNSLVLQVAALTFIVRLVCLGQCGVVCDSMEFTGDSSELSGTKQSCQGHLGVVRDCAEL